MRIPEAAFTFAALAVIGCARATAATQSGAITLSVPTVKTVASDSLPGSPIENSTVTARVAFDPRTLTSEAGVARFRQHAEPQVDEAIARSKDSSPG